MSRKNSKAKEVRSAVETRIAALDGTVSTHPAALQALDQAIQLILWALVFLAGIVAFGLFAVVL